MGQTVNLLSLDFGGSNPSAPTDCTITDMPSGSLVQAGLSLFCQLDAAKSPAEICVETDIAEIAQSIEH